MKRRVLIVGRLRVDLASGRLEGTLDGSDRELSVGLPRSELLLLWALSELAGGPASAERLATLAWHHEPDAAALAERVLARLRGRLGDALVEQAGEWRLRFVAEGALWQLRVTGPDGTLFAVGVDRNPLRVGRAPDNDLVLPASEVSRHHAVIRLAAGGLVVQDCSSGNGIYVDGNRVAEAVVSHGERFEIRPYGLEVIRSIPGHVDSDTTRISAQDSGSITLVSCRVELDTHLVVGPDGETSLTNTEWSLFDYLRLAAPRAVSREELLDRVWGYHHSVHSRTVDTTLYRLRTKIERNAREPDHLLTVRGMGYRFVVPASDPAAPDGDVSEQGEAEAPDALASRQDDDDDDVHDALLLRALSLYRASGRRTVEAGALVVHGRRLGERGRYDEARVALETALEITGASGSTPIRSRAWRVLGDIARLCGDREEAGLLHARALAVALADGQEAEAVLARHALEGGRP